MSHCLIMTGELLSVLYLFSSIFFFNFFYEGRVGLVKCITAKIPGSESDFMSLREA